MISAQVNTQMRIPFVRVIWPKGRSSATDPRYELDGLEEIRVRDNGHGMLASAASESFGELGGSWKREARQSPSGRALHGRDGRGRFRAAGIGSRIVWRTVAADEAADGRHISTSIELQFSNLVHVVVSDPEPTDESTGTTASA
ncbi:MAG TPA: hypothetical protein VKB03_15935 [Conexibacter sp.]|nr:hypothetical protein [Conexibacter sp.]